MGDLLATFFMSVTGVLLLTEQFIRRTSGRRRVHGFTICGAFMLLGAVLSVVVQPGTDRLVAVYVCLIAAVWGVARAQQRHLGIRDGAKQNH